MTRRKSEQIDVLEALRSLRRRAADDDQLASKILTAAIREIEDLRIKVEDLEAQLADPLRDLLDTPETVEAKVKNAAALAAHLRDLLQDCGGNHR